MGEEMIYLIIGLVLIAIGLTITVRQPRKWRTATNILYVLGMVLTLFAIFVLHDPIEGIPSEIMTVIQIAVIFMGFYGFLYKIEHDLRNEFNDRLGELKRDIQRDIDRLEERIDKR